jgi:hypothetical protein
VTAALVKTAAAINKAAVALGASFQLSSVGLGACNRQKQFIFVAELLGAPSG